MAFRRKRRGSFRARRPSRRRGRTSMRRRSVGRIRIGYRM